MEKEEVCGKEDKEGNNIRDKGKGVKYMFIENEEKKSFTERYLKNRAIKKENKAYDEKISSIVKQVFSSEVIEIGEERISPMEMATINLAYRVAKDENIGAKELKIVQDIVENENEVKAQGVTVIFNTNGQDLGD